MNLTGNKKCFLDTCIVIEVFKNTSLLSELVKFETIYLSNIVLGELYFGAYTSADPLKHIRQIEHFISLCSIINCDEQTSIFYGQIKSILKKTGKPIPENDIWIAALSKQHALSLYTIDKHFSNIPGLAIIS